MTLPRDVQPGRYYLITRRCTQRRYLLRPDRKVNEAFTYCLICAAKKYDIKIVSTCAMSNHHHTLIYDQFGRYPEFLEHFHKLVARCLNAYRGRWENFWSSEQVCVVKLEKGGDILDKLVYVFANPVTAHLVERAQQWPGVNSYSDFLTGRTLRAKRPKHFFRENGTMPEEVELELYVPPELGERDEAMRTIRERVEQAEDAAREERRRNGTRLVGTWKIKNQDWDSRPKTREPRRNLRPRIAAKDKWVRIERIQRNREFQEAYKIARRKWLAKEPAAFPVGTYWLHRFAAAPIATKN